ncbi:MAG TPA: hypothetical protein VF147_14725, partial [Vicinamibacterales bacterium]
PGGTFSPPLRVNSIAGSAMATGNVRGGQVAIGRDGRPHVTWNGATAITSCNRTHIPLWYSRLSGDAFEPQRDLTEWTVGLDGGGTIAADASGHVYASWHSRGTVEGEDHRTVYVASSSDEGRTFTREQRATTKEIGACGCCGMRSLVDANGALQILYRAAGNNIHRDATWLTFDPGRKTAEPRMLQEWELQACPMSTFAMTPDGARIFAAWETKLQINYATLDPGTGAISPPAAVPGTGARKHPSVAINAKGERLIAWTEGMAWSRGGMLSWIVIDRSGKVIASAEKAADVPAWSLVSAVANTDGAFTILY